VKHSLSLVVAFSAAAAGCAVGPNYKAPELPQAHCADLLPGVSSPADASHGAISAETLARWWQSLNDPTLTELIREGVKGSLDLRDAQASIREAQARLWIARAPLFPQLDASGLYLRERASAHLTPEVGQPSAVERAVSSAVTGAITRGVNNTLGVSGGVSPGGSASAAAASAGQRAPVAGNYYQAGFDAAWEIDIFGGTRRSIEAASAELQAQEENLNSVWVSLAAEIAVSYVDVRTAQRRLQVARDNLDAQARTLELLESRQKAGLSDELAVQQARYNLERTRSTIPAIRTDLEGAMNSLAVLTGVMPGTLHERLSEAAPIPTGTLRTVTGIPADVLRQRPDIRVAERALAAQTARIGQATAELFPKFELFGTIGWESLDEATLFSHDSLAWDFGPRFSWPIFHGGSILRNIEVQDALQEQLLARYKKTVLAAVKEVRDSLMAYAQEQERRDTLATGVEAAQAAVEIAQDKYRSGLTDFNNVLDAQRSLLSFQEALALSEGAETTNLIRLYKALGGGWQSLEQNTEDNSQPAHTEEGHRTDATGTLPASASAAKRPIDRTRN
jgi:multidrug efflux system outer membrane protein